MEAKTILIGIIVGIIVGGALVYTVTPRYDPTAYQSQIEELSTSVSNQQNQINDLETELTSVQDEYYRYESAIEALNVEIENLSDENDALREQLNSLLGTEEEAIDSEDESQPQTYLYNVEIKGDWVIDDYQEINDTFLTVDGSIFIEGDGKLVIRDSYLNITMDYNFEHTISVGDEESDESPGLELYNVTFNTEGVWMVVEFGGRSKIIFDNVQSRYHPWYVAGINAEVTVTDSDFGITLGQNATLRAEDSFLFLEITLNNISGTYSFPIGEVEELNYVFEKGRDTAVIETSGCTFREWGVGLNRYTNITFVDSVITIGMHAGLHTEVPEETIVLSGLNAQRYDYFVVDYDTNHLELVNSTVTSWYPHVFGGAVLEISDSYLADLKSEGGDSIIIVRNCTVLIVHGVQEMTYYFYNSTIQEEVTATDDSRIFLYNTEVGGKITEVGNGQVFIDDEPRARAHSGTDLEIAYIERVPKYPRYDVDYTINHQFTDDFTPYSLDIATCLKSGQTSQTKRWPAQDEVVTFIAHLINRGTNPIDQFNYQWLLDDNPIESGTYKDPILPGKKAKISVRWPWDSASHRIKFLAPLKDDLTPSNNILEDYTDALSFFTFIDRSYDQQFAANTAKVAHPTTSSILECLQLHIKKFNQMFEEAGATTRVRYDLLEIINDNASLPSQDRLIMYDGSFPNRFEKGNKDLRLGASAYYDQEEDIDYGLLHELGHQLGLIDIYRLDISKSQNKVNGESRRAIFGLMDGVFHFISEHSALALNSWQAKRRGYFGQYLYDIPTRNRIKFLEANGNPLTEANITVYQKVETEGIGERIPNIPKFQGMTDDNGFYVLPNVAVDNSLFTPTETGNELRPNPFGYISNHGENGVFLLKIEKGGFPDYQWIDITKFNIAYWKGETEQATYQIKTRLSSQVETELPPELTENAENWLAEASDGSLTTVENDYTFKQVGKASIKLVTESGSDVSLRYPILKMAEWNLSNKDYLTIWFYSENLNIGFQDFSPWIRLINLKTDGYFQYQTDRNILDDSQGKWYSYKIPLTGDELWHRTKVGEVSLREINCIEIHADTWDYGFTLWIDGLSLTEK